MAALKLGYQPDQEAGSGQEHQSACQQELPVPDTGIVIPGNGVRPGKHCR